MRPNISVLFEVFISAPCIRIVTSIAHPALNIENRPALKPLLLLFIQVGLEGLEFLLQLSQLGLSGINFLF